MRAVNLLPQAEQRARLEGVRTPLLVAAGGIAAVTTAAVMLAMSASGAAEEKRVELAAVETTIKSLPDAPEAAVSQPVLLQERRDRVAALAAALSTRVSFDRVLSEISLVLPEDAWLTGLTATAPAVAAPVAATTPGGAPPPPPVASSGPEGVTIQGSTYSHDSVARVLARLSVVPSLENVRLTGSARVVPQEAQSAATSGQPAPTQKAAGRPVVTFTISASLRPEATS
ncbi:MAG: PilN domain-containing protein [Actinobacteria bacterium]|nr:PilN domain-containing protein [Actinomycetota bacterium]